MNIQKPEITFESVLEALSFRIKVFFYYLIAPFIPLAGLVFGVWIVIRTINQNSNSLNQEMSNQTAFWMLLAGALVFGCTPIVWRQFFGPER